MCVRRNSNFLNMFHSVPLRTDPRCCVSQCKLPALERVGNEKLKACTERGRVHFAHYQSVGLFVSVT